MAVVSPHQSVWLSPSNQSLTWSLHRYVQLQPLWNLLDADLFSSIVTSTGHLNEVALVFDGRCWAAMVASDDE
ncbi:hypothetical protein C8J56DRAFT_1050895 [Mycena floridula]|nr:hypothetical protein C8J56DRAFT_1050895 [Mycena floridula]